MPCYPFRTMRLFITALFCLTALVPSQGQSQGSPIPSLPRDPREILAAAAPFYDFSSATLKPWHIKASYQLYDDSGNPSEHGTFEYWWASPQVYRASWTRPGVVHNEWHTADGKHLFQASGEPLRYFEYKLQSALLSPLPNPAELDPKKVRLDRQTVSVGTKLPCIMVVPLMPEHGQIQTVDLGLFPTYCFDSRLPALRISDSFGTVAMEFNKIAKVQGKFLPREINFYDGKRKILAATVDTIQGMPVSDPALVPPADTSVRNLNKVNISAGIAVGSLINKQVPIYPQDAKSARVSGRVILQATIGTDGGVHDLHVVSTPWPSLAASALWAVSHWQYKPYILNGEPVEVETTVNVIYSLSE